MTNRKSSKIYTNEKEPERKLFLKNCLECKTEDNDYKELNKYLVRDNIDHMLIVSLILIFISISKCVCRMNHIWYSDAGIGMLLVSVFYIFLWYFIKNNTIESMIIQKCVYITFWILVSVMELKYLNTELQDYHTILNYFIMLFLITGFLITTIQNTLLLILADSFIAIPMIADNPTIDMDYRIYSSTIIIIALISILIMIFKYYNYIKDKRAIIAIRTVGEVDTLTNLLNRRGFEKKLTELWPLLRDSRKTIMAIMIDIDNFKSYNDTYGHIAGDQCLKDVTECIYDIASRMTDLVVRYGGEEIVVAMTEGNEENCFEVAQTIQERINSLYIKAGTQAMYPYVTVSMGIASMIVNNTNTIYDLIDKADEQLYYAKNSGRNRIAMNHICVEKN
ncbi:MAG: GGDEF domain-containing protein [Lachnotalea sp.]